MVTPDGKKLFFTWGITGTIQVWRLDGAQKFPVQVTGGQDATTIAGIMENTNTGIGQFMQQTKKKRLPDYRSFRINSG